MPDRHVLSPKELDRRLSDLGRQLRWPPTPDLASAVLAELPAAVPPRRFPQRAVRWMAAAALLATLLAAFVLAVSESTRDSVATILGIGGIRIEVGHPSPASDSQPELGTPTTIQDLHRWLPFTPRSPALLGPPDTVYLHIVETGQPVGIMTWPPSASLPVTEQTGLGALLMEFGAPPDAIFMLKTVDSATATVVETAVDGNPAYWIEGASSLTVFAESGGRQRASGNVLLWVSDGVGYRFESALPMERAIAIAESLRPLDLR